MPSSARRFLVLAPVIALLMAWFPTSALAATCPGDFRQLCQAAVTPSSGTTSTTFTFSVVYQDSRNRSNFSVVVRIDGVNRAMSPSGTVDLVDGTRFVYKTKLADGTHQYRFRASLDDGSRPSIRTDTVTLTVAAAPAPTRDPKADAEAHAEADPEADAEADPRPAGHTASDPEADTEGHAEADPEADVQDPDDAPTHPRADLHTEAKPQGQREAAGDKRGERRIEPTAVECSEREPDPGRGADRAGRRRRSRRGRIRWRTPAVRIGRSEQRWRDLRPHRPAADRVDRRVPVPVGPPATTRSTRVGGRDGGTATARCRSADSPWPVDDRA